MAGPRSRSCTIDGEAVCCGDDGAPSFDRIRYRRHDAVFLYAFDLIELNGDDLRRDPLEVRNAMLASVLAKAGPGIRFTIWNATTRDGVSPGLQDGPGGHCVEAEGFPTGLGGPPIGSR
jgi:ATP-dependent DNA ligase